MKQYIKFCLLLFGGINVIFGQDTTEMTTHHSFHALSATIGVNQIKGKNLLPRVHTGYITTFSYDYSHILERYQKFKFAFGISRVIATPEDVTKSINIIVTSSYSHCFKTIEDQSITYFLGPQANIDYSVSYYPNWDDSHLYWGNIFSVGINNVLSYTFSDSKIFSTLSISLFSLYSRPDGFRLYKVDDITFGGIFKNLHKNLKLGFVTEVSSFHFDVEYAFPVFQTKMETVFYSVDFVHIGKKDSEPFTQLIHQLGLRILL